ncbi:MAG: hypothetical protein EXS05_22745 [Planctomycetaceae bacterium]|nr:hypothetical protein [Planctomycetaceae bacterium]
MGRWCRFLAAGLCLAINCGGCTTPRMGDTFGNLGSKARTEATRSPSKTRRTQPANEPADDAESDVMFTQTLPPRESKELPPPRRKPAPPSGSTETDAASDSPDLAIADLVQLELQDADPVERQELLDSFRDLPDASVKRILTQRRRGLQMASQSTARRRLGAVASESESPNRTTGGERITRDSGSEGKGAGAQGLGTISAWGHTTTANRPAANAPDAAVQPTVEGDHPPETAPTNRADPDVSHAAAVNASVSSESAPHRGHSMGYGSATRTTPAAAPPAAPSPAAGIAKMTPGAATVRSNPLIGFLTPGSSTRSPPAAAKPEGAPSATNSATFPAAGTPPETGVARTASAESTEAVAATNFREILKQLIAVAETEAARLAPGGDDVQREAYIERQVHLRMLYLMAGQQERALKAIPGIEPADQEFWQQTFWGMTNYFDSTSMPTSAERASQTVSQLTKAVLRLQERANLELTNVNFCHKIASFGNYDKYPRDEFNPGQEVLMYAEVGNVRSDPGADGRFRSSLKSTLEILRHGPGGEALERIELPETVDFCRAHRRDYFHSYQFTIPPRLTAGPHVLKLLVEDQLSRRTATYSLNFTVK